MFRYQNFETSVTVQLSIAVEEPKLRTSLLKVRWQQRRGLYVASHWPCVQSSVHELWREIRTEITTLETTRLWGDLILIEILKILKGYENIDKDLFKIFLVQSPW